MDTQRQKCLKILINKGQQFVVHSGGENGFVPNALLMFKLGSKQDNYRDIKYEGYEKLTEMLILNLNKNSVIIIDNVSYVIYK